MPPALPETRELVSGPTQTIQGTSSFGKLRTLCPS